MNDALWNDGPYTGKYTAEMQIPTGKIQEGESFHVCLEEKSSDHQSIDLVECFQMHNSEENKPEDSLSILQEISQTILTE